MNRPSTSYDPLTLLAEILIIVIYLVYYLTFHGHCVRWVQSVLAVDSRF